MLRRGTARGRLAFHCDLWILEVPPTVHLLSGIPGCGKTRFATSLAARGRCVALSHDEWIVGLLGPQPGSDDFQRFAVPIHELLWRQAEKIVRAGTDVVLDFGFWTRAERDAARARVQAMGAQARFYAFECTAEEAWRRISRRNENAAEAAIHISEDTFKLLLAKVEPLMPDEAFMLVKAG